MNFDFQNRGPISAHICLDCNQRVYALVDLYGAVEKLTIVSKELSNVTPDDLPKERRMSLQSTHSRDSLEVM